MSNVIVCKRTDLVPLSGVCVKHSEKQIAIFYLPANEPPLFALDNWDPIGKANVMSRGIIGSVGDELVVASPLYKQHYSLSTGKCLEEDAALPTYVIAMDGDDVSIQIN